jgi:hypothetical protein
VAWGELERASVVARVDRARDAAAALAAEDDLRGAFFVELDAKGAFLVLDATDENGGDAASQAELDDAGPGLDG